MGTTGMRVKMRNGNENEKEKSIENKNCQKDKRMR